MGVFVYMFFGTSKDITLGPTAILSLLTASLINASTHDYPKDEVISLALLLTFMSGLVQVLMGALNLGECKWERDEMGFCALIQGLSGELGFFVFFAYESFAVMETMPYLTMFSSLTLLTENGYWEWHFVIDLDKPNYQRKFEQLVCAWQLVASSSDFCILSWSCSRGVVLQLEIYKQGKICCAYFCKLPSFNSCIASETEAKEVTNDCGTK